MEERLYGFVASKVLFCLAFLLVCSVVMLGVGGLIFKVHWRNPLAVAGLTAGYCVFTAGLMSLLPALVREARTAQVLSNLAACFIGLVGGSTFPVE